MDADNDSRRGHSRPDAGTGTSGCHIVNFQLQDRTSNVGFRLHSGGFGGMRGGRHRHVDMGKDEPVGGMEKGTA